MQLHHFDIIDSVTEQVDCITGLLFKLFCNSCVLLVDFHFFCLWSVESSTLVLEVTF